MGFSKKIVAKAIQEHGEEDADSILESFLLYSALENSTPEQDSPPDQSSPSEQCFPPQQQQVDSDPFSSDYEGSFLDGYSDLDSSDNEEIFIPTSEEVKKLVSLVNMGYTESEASSAIERCGVDSSLVELTDFISAAQLSKAEAEDANYPLEKEPRHVHIDEKKKRNFQIDTVAYHLSVLKERFPNGINVLSLFSGIGGPEIALHRLRIRMKNVVYVELSTVSKTVVRTWWEQTNQKGNLYHLTDVQELNADRLEYYINTFGGFDLVVGGSPCNNLAGSNRHHRDGLEGKESSLFYDYFRILDSVKGLMTRNS